ncbi:hypothetical protein BGW41_007029 [Actinomortierella wolfii]|nr:hypothetical protein BGW41_007029 [Actinomortierella wolfii]
MSDLSGVYKDLLAANGGDILVKLKDGKQLKIISYLIKRRSPVFKTMLESPMQESTTGVVDLSSQYSLEAFREFMSYIYYNKLYTGSYMPILFEVLSIADYYGVDSYKSYISGRITELVTDVPLCLMIASEALKYGALTDNIYAICLEFLMKTLESQDSVCYDKTSSDSKAWCCSNHSTKAKTLGDLHYSDGHEYMVDGQMGCIYSTLRKKNKNSDRTGRHSQYSQYTQRCCLHGPKKPPLVTIDQLPDFIADDINSAKIDK